MMECMAEEGDKGNVSNGTAYFQGRGGTVLNWMGKGGKIIQGSQTLEFPRIYLLDECQAWENQTSRQFK